MFKKIYSLSVYFLAFLSMIFFFLLAIMPDRFDYAFGIVFGITMVAYFAESLFNKIQDKFELFSDLILFISFSFISVGTFMCVGSFFPYSFYLLILLFTCQSLVFIGFCIRFIQYCGRKCKKS